MAPGKPMPMMVPVVERAFQLAQSGEFLRIEDVAARLVSEGYLEVEEHMWCPLLRQQLRCALLTAQKSAAPKKGLTFELTPLAKTTSAGVRPSGCA